MGLASGALGDNPPPIVEAQAVLATNAVHPGSVAKAAVVARIASGYHINDHTPSVDYLIPTEVKLESMRQVGVKRIFYPRGGLQKFAFADQALSVYEGTLMVGALLSISPSAAPGEYAVKGKLSYQACNDHACFPPASVPLRLKVAVVGRDVPLKRLNEDVFRKVEFK